jgi:hypothetical protein
MSTEAILYGTVLFHDRLRGYGFIIPETGGQEVFFPTGEINLPKQIRWHVRKLMKVSYILKPNTRSPEKGAYIAGNVTPLVSKEPEPTPAASLDTDGGVQ